jgi:hypothetical protein
VGCCWAARSAGSPLDTAAAQTAAIANTDTTRDLIMQAPAEEHLRLPRRPSAEQGGGDEWRV